MSQKQLHISGSLYLEKCEKSNQEKREVEETDEEQASPGRPCNRLHLGSNSFNIESHCEQKVEMHDDPGSV